MGEGTAAPGLDEKALGKKLQAARQKAGLTQQELCQKAGLSYSTLAKIERGAIKAPSVFTVATISQATGVPLEQLLDMPVGSSGPAAKKTSKTGVQFVYFDLNNTLVRGGAKAFTRISELVQLPVDLIEANYWRYNNSVCSGQMSLAEFNKVMGERLNLPEFDWASYYLEAVEPMPGMSEVVDWAAANYELGLLSNTMPELIAGLGRVGKINLDKFSKIIDSSEVKMLKDKPAMFEHAQSESAHAPTEILLVDDDTMSIAEANSAGWQICRFNPYDPEESIGRVKQHLAF